MQGNERSLARLAEGAEPPGRSHGRAFPFGFSWLLDSKGKKEQKRARSRLGRSHIRHPAFRCSRPTKPRNSFARDDASPGGGCPPNGSWKSPSAGRKLSSALGFARRRLPSRNLRKNTAASSNASILYGPGFSFLSSMPGNMSHHASRVRTLYRKILQLHRALPLEMKALGDQYVKDEFRRHKSISLKEAQHFLQEWENYVMMLQQQANQHIQNPTHRPHFGAHLSEEKFNALRDEQIGQLQELMQEATKPKRQFNILDDGEYKN